MNLLVYIIAYPFIWLISRLNFSTIYLISDFLYYVLYYVFSYRKSVVRENLKLAFPEMSKKERLEIEKENFRNLTDIFLETFKNFRKHNSIIFDILLPSLLDKAERICERIV